MSSADFRSGQRALRLGCIADDFTGATDLASNLVQGGMKVVQTIGIHDAPLRDDVDAVVVALKTRTLPADEAVRQSLEALAWLKQQGAEQIYFKYCSTFDSLYEGERRGNIGPVTEALMVALGTDFTVATPAFPDNLRSVFKGHLFVGDVLLAESGMRNHPLTPMTDSNLVRVMQAQCEGKVGLLDYSVVVRGTDAVKDQLNAMRSDGVGIAMLDALSNHDLKILGKAVAGLPLVTAGSGLAIGLADNFSKLARTEDLRFPSKRGFSAVISGSCSAATVAQVQHFIDAGFDALAINPRDIAAGHDVVSQVLDWASSRLCESPVLIYSSAETASVKLVQAQFGVTQAGELIEKTLAAVSAGLVALGVAQLVIAGGETSGACVQALGISSLVVGPAVAPGVPWCHATVKEGKLPIHVLLKSGNFGAPDLFSQAFKLLP